MILCFWWIQDWSYVKLKSNWKGRWEHMLIFFIHETKGNINQETRKFMGCIRSFYYVMICICCNFGSVLGKIGAVEVFFQCEACHNLWLFHVHDTANMNYLYRIFSFRYVTFGSFSSLFSSAYWRSNARKIFSATSSWRF